MALIYRDKLEVKAIFILPTKEGGSMDTVVYDKLKEKIGTEKIVVEGKEVDLLALVSDWEEGVIKTRAANKDLTQQREKWETAEKEYKKTLTDLSTAKTELEKKISETTGKAGEKTTELEEMKKTLNAMTEQITSLTTKASSAEAAAELARENMNKANQKASEETLRKELMTELGDLKIVGTQADFAITAIFAKGFAKLVPDSETGFYQRSFCTIKDGKELRAENAKTLCKWFAENHPFLVSGSGKSGTGMPHDSKSTNPGGNTGNYFSMIQKRG